MVYASKHSFVRGSIGGIKAAQNAEIERKEIATLQRLTLEADIEEIRVSETEIKKQTAQINVKTTTEADKQAQLTYQTATVQTQITQVQLGKTQDKLIFETGDRLLTQQEWGHKLQLKAINIASLKEQTRHQEFLWGKGEKVQVNFPKTAPQANSSPGKRPFSFGNR